MSLFVSLKEKMSRSWRWLKTKIQRDPGTPEYVARGWAIGMFYGTFIPFGLQLVLSIPTAYWLRGSKIGATFGTFLTNPVTIWFIYPVQCFVGTRILGCFTGTDYSYDRIRELIAQVISADGAAEAYRTLFGMGAGIAAGFFIGGALLSLITVPPTYFLVRSMVIQYRAMREKRRKKHETASR